MAVSKLQQGTVNELVYMCCHLCLQVARKASLARETSTRSNRLEQAQSIGEYMAAKFNSKDSIVVPRVLKPFSLLKWSCCALPRKDCFSLCGLSTSIFPLQRMCRCLKSVIATLSLLIHCSCAILRFFFLRSLYLAFQGVFGPYDSEVCQFQRLLAALAFAMGAADGMQRSGRAGVLTYFFNISKLKWAWVSNLQSRRHLLVTRTPTCNCAN